MHNTIYAETVSRHGGTCGQDIYLSASCEVGIIMLPCGDATRNTLMG